MTNKPMNELSVSQLTAIYEKRASQGAGWGELRNIKLIIRSKVTA